MDAASVIALVNLFGALNGLLLGALLLVRSPDRRTGAFFLGGVLLVASLVMVLITLEHQGWVPRGWWLYATEEALSLLVGPLLLSFVALSFGRARPGLWIYAPVVAYVAVAFPSGGLLQRHLGMQHIMWIQMAYSVAAAVIFVRALRPPVSPVARRQARTAGFVLLCIFAIHVAQIARAYFSELEWVRNAVPITATLFFYALLVYALFHSRLLRSMTPSRPPAEETEAVFADVESAMKRDRPWANPAMDLTALSDAAGHPPHAVSAAINATTGRSFYGYVAGYRLAEAKRLLADPDEQRYAVEGIGRQCGFGSRSAFYKLFRQETGLSPAEYRKRTAGEASPRTAERKSQ